VILTARLLRDRRASTLWWALGLAVTVALVAISYSTVQGQTELDQSIEDLPESVKVLLGVGENLSLTSPAGYLNSQLFANLLPILLTIYGVGVGAQVIAGNEATGRLELLLAHPVSRRRVAVERAVGMVTLLAAPALTCWVVLAVLVPLNDLSVGAGPLSAAVASSALLALVHTAIAFGIGAWTGRRGVAIAVAASITAGGFLVQSLASLSDTLRPLRWLSPWQWFLDRPAIVEGWNGAARPAMACIAVTLVVMAAGIARFERRDLGFG